MRIWVDFTNTAHVIVLRPLVERLEAAGHDVALTARPLSHTVELLEEWGRPHTVIGRHGGVHRRDKALAAADRVRRLLGWARGRRFDRGLAHGSTDLPPVAPAARVPEHDDVRLRVGGAPAPRQLPARDARAGARTRSRPPGWPATAPGPQAGRLPGAQGGVLPVGLRARPLGADALGAGGGEVLCVVRTAPSYALYLGGSETPLLAQVLRRAAADERVRTVVLARTDQQRADVRALGLDRVVVPERTVDGRSLVALADVLVSAGGTMNREAAVLGTPVWSMFEGPLGGVDEQLVREGRLKLLADAGAIAFEPKPAGALEDRVRRDPADLLALAMPGLRSRATLAPWSPR